MSQQYPIEHIERIGTSEAKDDVDVYDGPMSDWDVHHVLRLINSFDSELFENVKDQCIRLNLKGTGTLINCECIYLVLAACDV